MNIFLLGYSGSGKTTYLSSLLNTLCKDNGQIVKRGRESVEYYIEPTKGMTVENLNSIMDEICTLQRSAHPVFCKPTNRADVTTISLTLNRKDSKQSAQKIIDFELIDYRGGILQKIANTEYEKIKELPDQDTDIKDIATSILFSDVVLVFVDASRLKERKKNMQSARYELGVRPITTILNRAREEAKKANKKIRVIFVLTKTDASNIESKDIPVLKKLIKELYKGLYDDFGGESDLFKIIDIATVGSGYVKTDIKYNDEGLEITHKVINYKDQLKPRNVLSVFAQAFIEGMDNYIFNAEDLSKLLEDTKLSIAQGLIDTFFNRGKKKKNRRNISKALKMHQEEIEKLKSLSWYKSELEWMQNKHL